MMNPNGVLLGPTSPVFCLSLFQGFPTKSTFKVEKVQTAES